MMDMLKYLNKRKMTFCPNCPDKLTDKHVPLARDSKLHMIKSMSIQMACGSAANVHMNHGRND